MGRLLRTLAIEPLIGGLRRSLRLPRSFTWPSYWTPYRGIETCTAIHASYERYGYWTPYRGIDTLRTTVHFGTSGYTGMIYYWTPYRGIETYLVDRNICVYTYVYWTPYRGIETKRAQIVFVYYFEAYWTPYRGIETSTTFVEISFYRLLNPL